MSRRLIITTLGAVLTLAPAVASAQSAPAGMMTWEMSATPPAALAAQAPMPDGVNPVIRITIGSDGKHIAMQTGVSIEPAPSPELAMLSAARMFAIWTVDADSMHLGLELPEPIRAMVAGMIAPQLASTPPAGYRVTMKLPNIEDALKDNIEKLDGRDGAEIATTALGTRAMVGGIECENWTMTSASDTATVCVVDRNTPAFALGTWFASYLKLDEAMKKGDFGKLFGGREVVPISMIASDGSFRMQLTGISTSAPAPSFFVMPEGFHTIDPSALPFGGGS